MPLHVLPEIRAMGSFDEKGRIEQLARALAANAGVIWEHLEAYPGYVRGIWRAKARQLIRQAAGRADYA